MICKAKSAKKKKMCGVFRPLTNKNVQMLDHFFPLLFPEDSESLKIFDIRLRKVGAKRPLNGTSKVNIQTHTQTHRRTFWLIKSIGPEGRCFKINGSLQDMFSTNPTSLLTYFSLLFVWFIDKIKRATGPVVTPDKENKQGPSFVFFCCTSALIQCSRRTLLQCSAVV